MQNFNDVIKKGDIVIERMHKLMRIVHMM